MTDSPDQVAEYIWAIAMLLEMHAALYAYLPGEGGAWKQRDNVIRQRLPDGREVVLRSDPLDAGLNPDWRALLSRPWCWTDAAGQG